MVTSKLNSIQKEALLEETKKLYERANKCTNLEGPYDEEPISLDMNIYVFFIQFFCPRILQTYLVILHPRQKYKIVPPTHLQHTHSWPEHNVHKTRHQDHFI